MCSAFPKIISASTFRPTKTLQNAHHLVRIRYYIASSTRVDLRRERKGVKPSSRDRKTCKGRTVSGKGEEEPATTYLPPDLSYNLPGMLLGGRERGKNEDNC